MKTARMSGQDWDMTASFWELADMTKAGERYKIDKNLQYLKIAPLEVLLKVFVQYRFFTHYYITDMAILISKLPAGELRSILADILREELGNGKAEDAHPELYDAFLRSMGIPDAVLAQADTYCLQNLEGIQQSLHNKSWAYGVGLRGMGGECLCQIYLATMHHYFSENLAVIAMHDRIDWRFWDIHIGEVDLHHQIIVRGAINQLIEQQPELANDLIDGYLESKQAWDDFWQRIFQVARQSTIENKMNKNEVLQHACH